MVAIQISNIVKCYGATQALKNVSLSIQQGEFFGLLGPNGAGKTTLISIVAGLIRADSGSIQVEGFDVVTDFKEARKKLGMVPQELVFDPFFTVRETLRWQSGYFGLIKNDDWIDEVLHNLGLEAKADTNMRSLSGGMKRRVLIAQALVHKPPVIVLDEPTAGVDVELRQTLWKFIARLNQTGHTIVLTTHYLEEAQNLCNRIAMLKNGEIVALDTTAALINRISGSQLILRLSAALPTSLQSSLPVITVSADKRHCVLRISDYFEVETILMQLRGARLGIEEMQLQQADLEDVFLQIMEEEGNV